MVRKVCSPHCLTCRPIRIARELLLLGRPEVGFGLFQGQPNEDRYPLLGRTIMCKGMPVGRLLDVGERGYRFCSARHVRFTGKLYDDAGTGRLKYPRCAGSMTL